MAQNIPAPFSTIASIEEARAAIEAVVGPLTTAQTYPLTKLVQVPDMMPYLQRMAEIRNWRAMSALGAEMVSDVLRMAAPLLDQVWSMSLKFQTRIRTFMRENAEVTFLSEHYVEYLGPGATLRNPEYLDNYNAALVAFRVTINGLKIDGDMDTLIGDVPQAINVQAASLAVLAGMLNDMRNKRTGRLEGATQGAAHLEETRRAFACLTEPLLLSYGLRRRKDPNDTKGKIMNADGTFTNLNVPVLLVSSAIAADRQRGGNIYTRITEFARDHPEHPNSPQFLTFIAEVDALETGGGQYAGQRSNIDSFFTTYFIVYKILRLSTQDFYKFQRIIYLVGLRIRGKVHTRALLNNYRNVPGVTELIANLSASTDIYLPPWVMNVPRLQDMVGIIGPCDSYSFAATLGTPAVSWRYLSGIKRDQYIGLRMICNFNQIERAVAELADQQVDVAIFQSEHMLHQYFLDRHSNFQNTNQKTGNALNVHFVVMPAAPPAAPVQPAADDDGQDAGGGAQA